MIIKKFTAKTEEDATNLAKAELGNNVVIMNVRTVRRKGLMRLLKRQQVEITVALEEENDIPFENLHAGKTDKPANNNNRTTTKTSDDLEAENIRETFRQVAEAAKAERKLSQQSGQTSNQTAATNRNVTAKTEVLDSRANQSTQQAVLEEKIDSLQNMLEKQLMKPDEDTSAEKEDEPEQSAEMIRFMKLLYSTMIDNEINEKYANQIIEEMRKSTKPNMPFDVALANVYQKMILKFGKAEPIVPEENGPKLVFFIGPTGVGKTTTIAKIASKFSVEEKKRVALLTADTYRIAAAEQLRTYANILEVPFRVIYSVDEMENALRDFRSYDYILVDTAGHSHQNVTQKENMNAFIHSLDGMVEKEVYLVLSATTKYRDLLSIADTYKDMTSFKLIFTKLDETTTLGNLLNLKLYTDASLSYVTCGQNVPDDIEVFDPQKTVKQLLGGNH